MPITKSAKKAARSSLKKREYNLIKKFKIKNAYKELRKAIDNGETDLSKNISKVYSTLDKAVKTNLLHKKTADRKKSRVVAMVKRTLGDKPKTEEKKVVKKVAKKAAPKKTATKKAVKKEAAK